MIRKFTYGQIIDFKLGFGIYKPTYTHTHTPIKTNILTLVIGETWPGNQSSPFDTFATEEVLQCRTVKLENVFSLMWLAELYWLEFVCDTAVRIWFRNSVLWVVVDYRDENDYEFCKPTFGILYL